MDFFDFFALYSTIPHKLEHRKMSVSPRNLDTIDAEIAEMELKLQNLKLERETFIRAREEEESRKLEQPEDGFYKLFTDFYEEKFTWQQMNDSLKKYGFNNKTFLKHILTSEDDDGYLFGIAAAAKLIIYVKSQLNSDYSLKAFAEFDNDNLLQTVDYYAEYKKRIDVIAARIEKLRK